MVPFDGSQNSFRGLEKAIYLARECNAIITGYYVAFVPPKLVFESVENIDSATMKKINKFLEKAKTMSAQQGIMFEYSIDHGKPEEKIIEFATRWNYDLLVMGSKGAGSKNNSMLGSVANRVLKNTKIPVLIVK